MISKNKIVVSIVLLIVFGAGLYAGNMLFGSAEKGVTPLQAGDPWVAYTKELAKAAEFIHRDETEKDPLTIAEGYRFFARLLRLSWEHTYEYADPSDPKLFKANDG